MWFSPRALKSCWRSSSRPDTRWSSRPRTLFGLTDIWRTNTPMWGRATGSSAQGVGLPSLAAAITVLPFIWMCKLKNAIVHIWDQQIKTLMIFSTLFTRKLLVWSLRLDILYKLALVSKATGCLPQSLQSKRLFSTSLIKSSRWPLIAYNSFPPMIFYLCVGTFCYLCILEERNSSFLWSTQSCTNAKYSPSSSLVTEHFIPLLEGGRKEYYFLKM